MSRAQGARAQMALAFEDQYGVTPADGTFYKMPFASASLGSEQPLLESELLGYGRDPLAPIKDAVTADGDVVVPIDARFLGIWLKAIFGEPLVNQSGALVERGYYSGQYGLPSMSVEVGNPEVPSHRMMTGVKANSISWSMQRSGLVTATIACIAQGEKPSTAFSEAGELAELPLTRFGSFNGAIKRGGVTLGNVVSGSVTYTNNLDRVETIRADGLIDGADEGMAMFSGEIVTRFADTSLFEQAMSGEPIELSFTYAIGTSASFDVTAKAVYLPRPRISLDGPNGVQVTYAWQAALPADGSPMVKATLINDVEQYLGDADFGAI